MRPFHIAFLIAALAAALFFYERARVGQINVERAALEAKIAGYEDPLKLTYKGAKLLAAAIAVYMGYMVALPYVAGETDEDVQEALDYIAAKKALDAQTESGIYAGYYRNAGFIVCVGALLLGDFLKKDEAKRNKTASPMAA